MSDECRRLSAEIEDAIIENEVGFRIIDRKLLSVRDAIIAESAGFGEFYDPADDVPLSLDQVLCLPELGGVLCRKLEDSIRSPSVFKKTLYKAIGEGVLLVTRTDKSTFKLSRRQIRAWLELCAVPPEVMERASVPNPGRRSKIKIVPMGEPKMAQNAVAAMLAKMQNKGN